MPTPKKTFKTQTRSSKHRGPSIVLQTAIKAAILSVPPAPKRGSWWVEGAKSDASREVFTTMAVTRNDEMRYHPTWQRPTTDKGGVV